MKVASEKRHKKVAGIYAMLLLLTAVFTGCSHDRDEFELSTGNKDYIAFRLTIPFSTATSRIDNQGHEEVDSAFPSFEDFINPNDIGIFLFLGEDDDAPFVGKWALLANSKDPNTSMTGYGSFYVITLRMTRDDLKKVNPDINIGPQSTDLVKFRVVTLANEGIDIRKENDYSTGYDECKTYRSLIEAAEKKSLSLGTSFYNKVDSLFVSSIPMFGMRLFEVRAQDLYYSRPDEVIELGDIYMLRSLAKVRLVDNTTKDAQGYPKISCEKEVTGEDGGLNYIYRQAYNLPLNAIGYQNGVQMDNIHLCEKPVYASYVGNIQNMGEEIYASYCPEQQVGPYTGGNGTTRQYPLFSFSYQTSKDGPWETRTVTLEGTKLPDGTFGLIRNHIYTVEVINEPVTARSGKGGDLRVKVSDRVW